MSWILQRARPEIVALKAYSHAAWEPSLTRLHANELPWRVEGDASLAGLNRYPEPQPPPLVQGLARLYGVNAEQLLVGRGSDEAIDLLLRIFCRAGEDNVIICPPTFGMYAVAARIQGAEVRSVPLRADSGFALDVDAVLAAVDDHTKLVFVCSPNNPTANAIAPPLLVELARKLAPRALLVVDEAYIDFAGVPSLCGELAQIPNLAILKTLSKAHGLAGARVGALIAAPAIIALARKVIPPYAITELTVETVAPLLQPAAIAAMQQRVRVLLQQRERLAAALAKVSGILRVWPSDANFLLFDCADPDDVLAKVRGAGLIIRDVRQPTLPQSLTHFRRYRSGERPRAGEPAMNTPAQKILFVDRDGTLIEEPADEQVDSLEKIRWMPDVFASLQQLTTAGFRLVMVTNQDGLGTTSFPQQAFDVPQNFVVDTLASQGLHFDAVCICPHKPADACTCRKPQLGLVQDYLDRTSIDLAASAMIGDRMTDLAFAQNLGVRGLRVQKSGSLQETWPAIAAELLSRRATVERSTKETSIAIAVDLDAEGPIEISTGHAFFDHMLEQLAKHGGFSLRLDCKGDLHVDEHHTVEDCALALGAAIRQALGDKRGIGRYGFLLPMDEARVQVAMDLSGRPYAVFEGKFARTEVGGLATELVPHFFRSLAETMGAALHITVTGDNTHHMVEACFKGVGRALRQALRREGNDLPSTKGVL